MAGDKSILEQLMEEELETPPISHEHKEALIRSYSIVGEKIASNPELSEAVERILHHQLEGPLAALRDDIKMGATPWLFSLHQGAVKMFEACRASLTDQSEIAGQVRDLTGTETED